MSATYDAILTMIAGRSADNAVPEPGKGHTEPTATGQKPIRRLWLSPSETARGSLP